jgi:para-nitrobenzyl esterase
MVPEIGDALTGSGPMSEDCLRLNVWTPNTDNGRRPVMVWFHGGGQRTGSGNSSFYDGTELARKHDVVIVTVTHRLNALAHLWLAGLPGTGEQFAQTANLGLQDLVAALRWVQVNIARFGGNPGNVTIFGQSGGGGKTAMLTAFPSAKGLFHKAIIMSTLVDTAVTGLEPARAVEAAELLLQRLDLKPAQASQLMSLPAERIISALTGGGNAGGQGGNATGADLSLRYVPVVDGKTLPAHPFQPASPLSADIPIMTGSNETEGVPYANPDDPYWTRQVNDDIALRALVKQVVPMSDQDADAMIALYRSHRPTQSRDDLASVMSGDNSALRLASYTIAERKFAQQAAPLYLYAFRWRSPQREGRLRSMHCMELPFVFDHPDAIASMTGNGPERAALAQQMSRAWVAFARTGNPNHSGIPKWDPWNPTRWPTMVFDRTTAAVDDPFGEERRAMAAARAKAGRRD